MARKRGPGPGRVGPTGTRDPALRHKKSSRGKILLPRHVAEQGKLGAPQIADLRQQKAQPILTKIREQLGLLNDQTPPQGLLGKAVGYAVGQWDRLTRYVENGILRPDNNLALCSGFRYPEDFGNCRVDPANSSTAA